MQLKLTELFTLFQIGMFHRELVRLVVMRMILDHPFIIPVFVLGIPQLLADIQWHSSLAFSLDNIINKLELSCAVPSSGQARTCLAFMRSLFTLIDLDSLDLPIWLVNLFLVLWFGK